MAVQLKDKVVIVTGSSSGIGEAIAITFASHGAKVTLCGRDQERLKLSFDKTVKAGGGHQDRVHSVQGDLNDQNVRKAIVAQTIEKFGRLDILVSNAGVILPKDTVSDVDEKTFDIVMNTNLKSVLFLTQLAIPHLEKTKGSIINISSVASKVVFPLALTCSLSKLALDHLTRSLAVDLGPKGIRVNSINPDYIPTHLWRHCSEEETRGVETSERGATPLKGRVLSVQDIVDTATFLVSDGANFITGQNIVDDGGRMFSGSSPSPN